MKWLTLLLASAVFIFFTSSFRSITFLQGFHREKNPSFAVFDFSLLALNGTNRCYNVTTAFGSVSGAPEPDWSTGTITLAADEVHTLRIVSFAADGSRRCAGGDFYETDLSGPRWKSRPPVTDLGDGSYLVELKVDGRFAGSYTFKAVLLFANFHGMDREPGAWFRGEEQFALRIDFAADRSEQKQRSEDLRVCSGGDLRLPRAWSGAWTRSVSKDEKTCKLDENGRYLCLEDGEKECSQSSSRCTGTLASLESNGWVYSPGRCVFHIWNQSEAWRCLEGKKLFFWGDSNHQDTIRNLANFVLGLNKGLLPRTFSAIFANPIDSSQQVEVVSIFNGHSDPSQDDMGLASIYVPEYRAFVEEELFRGGSPDVVVVNSGLHDGNRWKTAGEFDVAARDAAAFWKELVKGTNANVIFRSTVAPAGESRRMPSNPQKMEAFNGILGERMVREGVEGLGFVDAYDMTFPWHFGNDYSDGGHYGRPPSMDPWHGGFGHYYFVDLMLVHVLLASICS